MPLDRAISNLRQIHGYKMKSDRELREVVVAVLEGVREIDSELIAVGARALPVVSHMSHSSQAAAAWLVMIDRLIREASGDGAG